MDDFDSDSTTKASLLGAVNASHASDVEQLDYRMSARQRAADQRVGGVEIHRAQGIAARRTEAMVRCAVAAAMRARWLPRHGAKSIMRCVPPRGKCASLRTLPLS